MAKRGPREILAEFVDGECLCADGFDDAILGTVDRCGSVPVVLYDRDKCIEILIDEGMTEEDAIDHFEFNVIGGWVGDQTPMFATLISRYEL